MRSLAFLVPVLAGVASAQEPLGPRSFFPPEYQAEFFADVAALRANGFLDALMRSVAGGLVREIERYAMASIDHLERVRLTMRLVPGEGHEDHLHPSNVWVFEGKELTQERLRVKAPHEFGSFGEEQIGGHKVHVWSPGGDHKELFVLARDGVVVNGDLELLAPILEGQAKGGMAHQDLLALLGGKKVLAHLGMARCGVPAALWLRDLPGPAGWFDADDPIEGYCFRLVENDGVLELSLLARFAKDGPGIALFEGNAQKALAQAKRDRQLGAFKRIWNAITIVREGNELRARLVLGPPERAAGSLAQLMLPVAVQVLRMRSEVAAVVMQAAATEAQPEVAPAEEVPLSRPSEPKK